MLNGLYVEGVWEDDPYRLKDEVFKFYDERFKEVEEERPRLDGVSFKKISQRITIFI